MRIFLLAAALSFSVLPGFACAPIAEVTRAGEAASPLPPTTPVVVTGHGDAPKKLVEGALAVCADAPEAVRSALAEDASHVDWETTVVSVGRFHFVGEIAVRRPKNSRAALDATAAMEAAKAQARALGASLLATHRETATGAQNALASIELIAYRVDCAP